jgi:hypothetical protein
MRNKHVFATLGACVATGLLMFHSTPVHASPVPANDYEIAPSFNTLPEVAWFSELGDAAVTNGVSGAVAGAVATAVIGTPAATEAALVGGAAGALGGAAGYAVTTGYDALTASWSAADNAVSSTDNGSSDNSSSDNSSSDNSSSDNSSSDNSSSDNSSSDNSSSDEGSSDNSSSDNSTSGGSGSLLAHFVSGEVELPVLDVVDPALQLVRNALTTIQTATAVAQVRSLD